MLIASIPSLTLAQVAGTVAPLEIVTGRSLPLALNAPITKVTVANPEIADVVVIGETEVVINALAAGETDVILWSASAPRRHYRVTVRSTGERRQILLGVKFAEVRKDAIRNIATSLRAESEGKLHRGGTNVFRDESRIDDEGTVSLLNSRFATLLTTFRSQELLGLLEAEEQRGNARLLAEPNLMAANGQEASFLAGGEFPIPVVQGGAAGAQAAITLQFREFGIRLNFKGDVINDSLLSLTVKPEVSSLDYSNSITIQGFQIPALRTRRVQSTVDVLSDRSLVISGLFNEEREQVKTGLPFLINIPILGDLLSSRRWQQNESELLVVVTPIIMDPNRPRPQDTMELVPTPTPALPAIRKRVLPLPGVPPQE
jgi:pilus assembly protein CpaC